MACIHHKRFFVSVSSVTVFMSCIGGVSAGGADQPQSNLGSDFEKRTAGECLVVGRKVLADVAPRGIELEQERLGKKQRVGLESFLPRVVD